MDERCAKFAADASAKPTAAAADDAAADTPLSCPLSLPALRDLAIATLRKSLYRNQEQRLTPGASQALCDAVVRHAAAASASASATASASGGGGGGGKDEAAAAAPAVALLEDALAMPFNVFSTGHKRQMLTHLDRLRGAGGGAAAAAAATAAAAAAAAAADGADDASGARECSVLEAHSDGSLELMDGDGETASCSPGGLSDPQLLAEIVRALDAGEAVASK